MTHTAYRPTRRSPASICNRPAAMAMQPLERRTMLCALHIASPIHDLRPDLIGVDGPSLTQESNAQINWINRGLTSDGFAATFGGNAETARRVIDQVINDFERMIGSFNYGDGSTNFNLTVNMSGGNGNGASASLGQTLGGKPKSGTISMGRGGNGAGSGWFIDPTPDDHSEFMGNIVNAFSGDAQPGSPASGLGDFYTVAAAEITHVLGLYGNSLPLWSSKTTNTGIPDTAEGGGRGTFYVFQGPSIKHLLTSNNGGPNGQNWGSAVHGAGPGVAVPFGGDTYVGAQDIGNAMYEFSRRYIPSNTFALMFKDAFSYSTVNPATFGTFYSMLNPNDGVVTVRGGAGTSPDVVNISTSGNNLIVSVDVGFDIPGTGALPGAGNLPAFVSEFDISQVNSIVINTIEGNDTITIDSLPAGITATINAGGGNDTIHLNNLAAGATVNIIGGTGNDTLFVGGGDIAANILGTFSFDGQSGTDTITFDDSLSTGNNSYTISAGAFAINGSPVGTFNAVEAVRLDANAFDNAVTVESTAAGAPVTINAGAGVNVIDVLETTAGGDVIVESLLGQTSVNVNPDAAGAARVRFDAPLTQLAALDVSSGGTAVLTGGGSNVLITTDLAVGGSGQLDLNDNAMIVDYTGASPLAAIRNLLASGYNAGAWNGSGIMSTTAANDPGATTALGYGEAGALFSSFPAVFAGQNVDDTAILIRHTIYGDANLDGQVNLADFNRVAAGFGTGTHWSQGNFNYDSQVNLADFNRLAANFGQSAFAATTTTTATRSTVTDKTADEETDRGARSVLN